LYATAAMLGAALCVGMEPLIGIDPAAFLGMGMIALVRLVSVVYRWNMPKFVLDR
jgi:uncharacterized membrane protein YeiH